MDIELVEVVKLMDGVVAVYMYCEATSSRTAAHAFGLLVGDTEQETIHAMTMESEMGGAACSKMLSLGSSRESADISLLPSCSASLMV